MSKSVLLVDDSRVMLMGVKSNLEVAGFTVETAEDGVEAFDRLKSGLRPDLIITDINMPRMDGIEFIKQARSLVRFTPILALTTESQTEKRDQAKANGATGWMVKPIKSDDLITIIKKVLPGA